jgi:CDP-glucose 4,6-dehydratase
MFADAYRGKSVLITGHTGFKGAWLAEWLIALGANVTGYALPPTTKPALFEQLGLASRLQHIEADVRDPAVLRQTVASARPDFIFHLAAQPLVRFSYREPADTFSTNVMGTVNLLEAVRLAKRPCTIVVVTTDKCYENHETGRPYREEDSLGGHDPYSASKGATELVVSAYRRSYFSGEEAGVRLASARAGNVLGGGDWAPDRIVPDCVRALQRAESIPVRNRISTRPWQHVLEPLSGYLWLGARLAPEPTNGPLASAFNFGPDPASSRTVAELVQEILLHWPGRWEDKSDPAAVHEATSLSLNTDKARQLLQWAPVWSFSETIAQTVHWYREGQRAPEAIPVLTATQIAAYTAAARTHGMTWSGQ